MEGPIPIVVSVNLLDFSQCVLPLCIVGTFSIILGTGLDKVEKTSCMLI